MNRRDFLKNSALAVGGLALVASPLAIGKDTIVRNAQVASSGCSTTCMGFIKPVIDYRSHDPVLSRRVLDYPDIPPWMVHKADCMCYSAYKGELWVEVFTFDERADVGMYNSKHEWDKFKESYPEGEGLFGYRIKNFTSYNGYILDRVHIKRYDWCVTQLDSKGTPIGIITYKNV